MLFDSIKKLLSDTNQQQLAFIAESSGVPLPTLVKIKYGQSANPRIETVEKLARHFTLQPKKAA